MQLKTINKEFYGLIRDMIQTKEFRQMKHYKHHVKGSVYDHSIKVAYLCYKHQKRFGTAIDLHELVRGALLHDFYLYDWHDKSDDHKYHGFTHPKRALKNALEKYPDLTPTERDMIERHMFPLTLRPPKTRGGAIVCFYDKVAAISDYCSKNRWKRQHSEKRPF